MNTSSSESPTVFAAGVLLMTRQPRRFLLMRHAERWDMPKGHREPGETTLECALRETEEETGLSRTQISIDPDFLHTVEYDVQTRRYGSARKRLDLFLGWVEQEFEPTLTEHIGFEWFDWAPPHAIQERAIDPLLFDVALYLYSC
ncbi:MAG TPA: NUDIX domain-containing protein [Pirellulaceae bacterium]|jgi:8-oxo-dGTP pyrophosphatase MutT (NUDIX family)|nr:NUDIX domain-containing protein [Pirellulaceae bacterium]